MKKIKWYLGFWIVIIGLSSIGILIGMAITNIEEKHPEYLSAGLFKGFFIFMVALLISIYLHEFAHGIAFKVQGMGIRLLYIFPICVVKEESGLKISWSIRAVAGVSGIVIPQISAIKSKEEYEELKRKMKNSLVAGPLFSAFISVIAFVMLKNTKYISDSICSYYFLFFAAMFLWGIYINITSLINVGGIVGDYAAAKKIKKSEEYTLIQVYNYLLLQNNKIKSEMRTKQDYFLEEMHKKVQEIFTHFESDSMKILLIDGVLYESIIAQEQKEINGLNIDIDKLHIIISNVADRIQFEAYYRFFAHAIMYMYMIGKENEAEELWKKYSKNISNTKVGKYTIKQVESLIYKNDIEELRVKDNIDISSVDSLLSKIDNYYDDEIYINTTVMK